MSSFKKGVSDTAKNDTKKKAQSKGIRKKRKPKLSVDLSQFEIDKDDNFVGKQPVKSQSSKKQGVRQGYKDNGGTASSYDSNYKGAKQSKSFSKSDRSFKYGKAKDKKATALSSKKGSSKHKKSQETLRIIPLGGLDAIGKNMTAFECGDDMILIDAGFMFPDDEHVGVDFILPDYTYVLENTHKLRGIVITHAHEDHIGALPYLLKDLDLKVPILGSKLTLGLIEGKLEEHKLNHYPDLQEVNRSGHGQLGIFEMEFFKVNHSIPGAMGVFLRTPAGNVLHTGDFKLDQTPIDGELTDFGALAYFSSQGVDLMLSDSTNATVPNFTKSEACVGVTLRQVMAQAKRKVIVASFASHIHRIQQICDAAKLAGRQVAVTGRSMLKNIRISRDLGYLHVPEGLIIDAYEVGKTPPQKLVVLCTGSQGEPLSALARMSVGEHKTISIEPGDTVIISATPVPGNEKSVTRVINQLSKIGADVWDRHRGLVHVSGHAGSEELKLVLSLVKPNYFMPVHGEAMHLRAHARLAEGVGVEPNKIFILENGETLTMKNHEVKRSEPVESGIVYVDGSSVGDIGQNVLTDRATMSSDGMACVALCLDKSGRLHGNVEVTMRGIPGFDNDGFMKECANYMQDSAKEAVKAYKGNAKRVKKYLQDELSRFVWKKAKRRPVVIALVVAV